MKKKDRNKKSQVLSLAAITAFYAAASYVPAPAAEVTVSNKAGLTSVLSTGEAVIGGASTPLTSSDTVILDGNIQSTSSLPPLAAASKGFIINGQPSGSSSAVVEVVGVNAFSTNASAAVSQNLTLQNMTISEAANAVITNGNNKITLDNVTFTNNTNDIVNGGSVDIKNTVSSSGIITSDGALTITNSSKLISTGTIEVGTTGSIENIGTPETTALTSSGVITNKGAITNNGTMTAAKITSTESTASITNAGIFNSSGTGSVIASYNQSASSSATNVTGGTLKVTEANITNGAINIGDAAASSAEFAFSGGTIGDGASITINKTGTLSMDNSLKLGNNDTLNGIVNVSNGTLTLDGVIQGASADVAGGIKATSGTIETTNNTKTLNLGSTTNIENGAKVKLAADSTVNVAGQVAFNASGTNSDILNSSTVNVLNGSTVSVTGSNSDTDTLSGADFKVTGGSMNVSDFSTNTNTNVAADSGVLNLTSAGLANANDYIKGEVQTIANGLVINNSNATGVTLTGSGANADTIGANGVTLTSGVLNVGGYDASSSRGAILTTGGSFNVIEDMTLISGDNITLTNTSSIDNGKTLTLGGGSVTANGFATKTDGAGGAFKANTGTLSVGGDNGGLTLNNSGDIISEAVAAAINKDLTIGAGEVTLNGMGTAGTTDTLSSGKITVNGGSLIAKSINQGTVSIDAQSGTLDLQSGNLKAHVDDSATAKIASGTILTVTGNSTLSSGDDWNGKVQLSNAGDTLNLNGVEQKTGASIEATAGALNIGNTAKQTLNLDSNSSIQDGAAVAIKNASEITVSGGTLQLNSGDTLESGSVTLSEGNLKLTGTESAKLSTAGVAIQATGTAGKTSNLELTNVILANDNDTISSNIKATVDNLVINNNNANGVTLTGSGADADTIKAGGVTLENGILNVGGYNTAGARDGAIVANGGTLKIEGGALLLDKAADKIGENVQLAVNDDLTIASTNAGNVLNGNDTVKTGKTLTLDGGNVTIKGFKTNAASDPANGGKVDIKTGDVTISGTGAGQGLTLNNADDKIQAGAGVNIAGDLNINAGTVTLNGAESASGAGDDDTLTSGAINLAGGSLTASGFTEAEASKVAVNATGGILEVADGYLKATVDNSGSGNPQVTINDGAHLAVLGSSTLDNYDTWNGDIIVESEITLDGVTQGTTGTLSAKSGSTVNIGNTNEQTVAIASGSSVASDVKVNLANGNLNVKGGTVTLDGSGASADTLTKGSVGLSSGSLTMKNINTSGNVSLTAQVDSSAPAGTEAVLDLTNVTLNNASDLIDASVKATVDGLTINKGSVTLDGAAGTADTWKGGLTLSGGELHLEGVTQGAGATLAATSGDLYIGSNTVAQNLEIKGSGNAIAEAVYTKVASGSSVTVAGGSLELNNSAASTGAVNGDVWDGSLGVSSGTLTVNTVNQGTNATLSATGGNLNLISSDVKIGEGSTIGNTKAVIAGSADGSTKGGNLTITAGTTAGTGAVTLNSDDKVNTTITMGTAGATDPDGGTLNLAGITDLGDTTLIANSGNLNLTNNQELTIGTDSIIKKEAALNIANGTKIVVGNGGKVVLNSSAVSPLADVYSDSDTWNGEVTVTNGSDVEINGVNNKGATGVLTATEAGGNLKITGDGFTANNANDNIGAGANVTLNGNLTVEKGKAALNVGTGTNDDTLTSGIIKVAGTGDLTLDGVATADGGVSVNAADGKLTVGANGLTLNNGADTILAAADVEVQGDLTINKTANTGVTLGTGDSWAKNIALSGADADGAVLNLYNAEQKTGATINATKGTLNIGKAAEGGAAAVAQNITVSKDSSIGADAKVSINGGSIVTVAKVDDGTKGTLSLGAADDKFENGTLNLAGGSLTLDNMSTKANAKLIANTGDLIITNGLTLDNASDVIKDEVKAQIAGGLTIKQTAADGVTLKGGDDTVAGGVSIEGGKLTIGGYDTSAIGALTASAAAGKNVTVNIENGDVTLANAADKISSNVALNVNSNLNVKAGSATAGEYTLELNNNDKIDKNASINISDSGKVKADGFATTAIADGETATGGNINATGGTIDIEGSGLTLNNANDAIADAVAVNVNGNLNINKGTVTLNNEAGGTAVDTLTSGKITVAGGSLTANTIATNANTSIDAKTGTVIANGLTLGNTADSISKAVDLTVRADGLTVNAGSVTLDGATPAGGSYTGDTWGGTVTLTDGSTGTVNLVGVQQGSSKLVASGGNLNIGTDGTNKAATTVTVGTGSKIENGAKVNLDKDSKITTAAGGTTELNAGDKWDGTLDVTGGNLTLTSVAQGENAVLNAQTGSVTAINQNLVIGNGSVITDGVTAVIAGNADGTAKSTGTLTVLAGAAGSGTGEITFTSTDKLNTAIALGTSSQAGGTLNLNGVEQNESTLAAVSGNLNMSGQTWNLGSGQSIADKVVTAIEDSSELNIDGGTAVINGGGDNPDTLSDDSAVKLQSGSLTVSNLTTSKGKITADGGNLTLNNVKLNNADSNIGSGAIVKVTGGDATNPGLEIAQGSVILSSNGAGKPDDQWTALIKVTGGTLQYEGLKNNGALQANDGIIYIGTNPASPTPGLNPEDTRLTIGTGSNIENGVAVTVNGELEIVAGNMVLDGSDSAGAAKDTLAGGFVHLNGNDANLTMSNLNTQNAYLFAEKGNLSLSDVVLDNSKDFIDYAVSFSMNTNDLNIQKGTVKLDAEDPILSGGTGDKSISLNQIDGEYAMLGVDGLKTGTDAATGQKLTINLNKGHLEIENRGLELNNETDIIKQDIATTIKGDLTMNRGTVYLNGGDEWQKGNITVTNDAKLQFKDFTATSAGATKMTMDKDALVELLNSKVTVADANDIAGGTMALDKSSVLNVGHGNYALDTMYSSGSVQTINKQYQDHIAKDMVVLNSGYRTPLDTAADIPYNSNANFAIDLFARTDGKKFDSDTFSGTHLSSVNPSDDAVITINDWVMNGRLTREDGAVDRYYHFKLFDYDNIDENIKFAATDKEQFTPIGYYRLFAGEGGDYTLALTRYNKQVFRGQVATAAQFNNQRAFDDMVTSHVMLHGSRKVADLGSNRFAAAMPELGPYQYSQEEGGLWFKSYGDIERLSFNQDLNVHNVGYGAVIGADLPIMSLGKGWKFIPTPYIGYNGAHQSFNDVSSYQYGGQLGFMGTFMKGNYISSHTLYGGGYYNEMHVDGLNDQTGNWFWGTAHKLAYNWNIKRHFVLQPTMFLSYNMFGDQNWHTDFGNMGMRSGMLNGINVAPGLNLIYARNDWSIYGGLQYFYNINEQVSGRAGNVYLPNLKMRHGYIQYGLGATKNLKDDLAGYAQIMWRNGGRTGVAFQLGLQYYYDIREIADRISSSRSSKSKAQNKPVEITTNKEENIKPVSDTSMVGEQPKKISFWQKIKSKFTRAKKETSAKPVEVE